MTARITFQKPLTPEPCPGCGKPIMMSVCADVEPGGQMGYLQDGRVEMAGKVIGVRVDHNCIPTVKR